MAGDASTESQGDSANNADLNVLPLFLVMKLSFGSLGALDRLSQRLPMSGIEISL